MAYLISPNQPFDASKVALAIEAAVKQDGRFTCSTSVEQYTRYRKSHQRVRIDMVRLTESKPYCGQHPGECFISPIFGAPKKPKCKFLEWEDWVAFHALVNDVLDAHHVDADATTSPREPMDKGSRFYVRRGTQRRQQYDWKESWPMGRMAAPLRVWNHGTPDQFRG